MFSGKSSALKFETLDLLLTGKSPKKKKKGDL